MPEAPAHKTQTGGDAIMTGPALWVAGLLLALSNFMVVLDITIANVSVPNIAGGLAISPDQGTWVITSYAVAEAISVPLTGWLAQRFGAVKVFVLGMLGFGLCSAFCGLAPSLGVLVMFRVAQGLCGGPIMPLSQTLLRHIFPENKQAAALGLWGMTTVVAPIAGPLLGGIIVDSAGWPWVFYINVPIALFCVALSWRMLASRETPTRRLPIDYVGLGLLITWIGAMQIMLDKGKNLDWFQSKFIVGLAIVAVLGFIAFIIWELTDEHPIVDLRVFRHRGFTVASVIMSLTFGAFFASIVLLPLWLQTNMDYNATWAGRSMAVQGVFAVVMSPIVAQLSTKVDTRLLVSFGVFLMAIVALWRAQFAMNADFLHITTPQLMQGFAMPFFFMPLTALALSSTPPGEVASAAGLLNFTRTTAGAFGASIATTAWDNAATSHHTDLAGTLNNPQAALDTLGRAGFTPDQAVRQLDAMVQGQSVMLATNGIFICCAVVLALAAASIWLAPKPRMITGAVGGH